MFEIRDSNNVVVCIHAGIGMALAEASARAKATGKAYSIYHNGRMIAAYAERIPPLDPAPAHSMPVMDAVPPRVTPVAGTPPVPNFLLWFIILMLIAMMVFRR